MLIAIGIIHKKHFNNFGYIVIQNRPKPMKKYYIRYALEFLVITLGVTLSFFMEYRREKQYKEQLKEQSLSRVLQNLEIDNEDYGFNKAAHLDALNAIRWIDQNHQNVSNFHPDTTGYYIQLAAFTSTTFYDNQEEYRSLQNSGLIEFIEDEEIVIGLQNKYVTHEYMKHLEDEIDGFVERLKPYRHKNVYINSEKTNVRGYPIDATYTGDSEIPLEVVQALHEKRWWHELYLKRVDELISGDQLLIKEIQLELE